MNKNCITTNITESEFTGNLGGAIYYNKYGNWNTSNISNCTFKGNIADYGRALYIFFIFSEFSGLHL